MASNDANILSGFKIVYKVVPKLDLKEIEQTGTSGLFIASEKDTNFWTNVKGELT